MTTTARLTKTSQIGKCQELISLYDGHLKSDEAKTPSDMRYLTEALKSQKQHLRFLKNLPDHCWL
jgi:hypothetical protein